MEEVKNLTQDDVLDIIKDFPIIPRRNKVIITVNVDEDQEELNLSGASFSEEQYIIAVGSYAQDLKAGQKVKLDLEKLVVEVPNTEDAYNPIQEIAVQPIEVEGKIYGTITEDKISFLVNN